MATAGLIVAAGRGWRMESAVPKQYLPVGGRAILRRSIDALLSAPGVDMALTVIHPDDVGLYAQAVAGLDDPRLLPPVAGAGTRSGSVRLGLAALAPRDPEVVLIHDGARPFASAALISRVLEGLDHAPAVLPALEVVDALWREGAPGGIPAPVDRAGLRRAQTPQGFRFGPIHAAHRAIDADADVVDDIAVAAEAGLDVRVVPGDEDNFKITTETDLDRARRRFEPATDIRIGNGYDVHRFGVGDRVILCGVQIPFERGLEGHSDADVGMHAVTDAIFGAMAEGDIGRWFPPSDPHWKGADSAIFLRGAVARAEARGFAVANVDCTLVCEAPRIGPHAEAMRDALSAICGIDRDRVSVKATTSERLGFTGRGEGIAALATATLVRR
jgi:2-C-methyl-D-erythritol 4-phosphate cytidylyltransferase / 2-C-methyl-D-erythritol 2,4-cyclodiphosphate synthase